MYDLFHDIEAITDEPSVPAEAADRHAAKSAGG
jgi:hypothetical protein